MAEQPRRSGLRKDDPTAGPELLGDILGKLFVARGWGRRQDRLRLELAWREAVGPRFAEHTRLGSLRRGILEVIVGSSVLLQELSHYQKGRILTDLWQRLGDVNLTNLRFRAGVVKGIKDE